MIIMADDRTARPVDRRLLLRGGAVLAGAAGVSAVGAALAPVKAEAADGQFAVMGTTNTSASPTGLAIEDGGSATSSALSLVNPIGPTLELTPASSGYNGELRLGQIANTRTGPDIGVDHGQGTQTSWLATGLDLDQIPISIAVLPQRLVDTRTEAGRGGIRHTSADAFDSSFRLKAGAFLDVGIIAVTYFGLEAAFVNITATGSDRLGYLTAYPPGERPLASMVNYGANQSIANGGFIAAGVATEDPDFYVIRIYATAAVHVVVDLTGASVTGYFGVTNPSPTVGTQAQRRAGKQNRMKRVFG
jgi:hypothetical protein